MMEFFTGFFFGVVVGAPLYVWLLHRMANE